MSNCEKLQNFLTQAVDYNLAAAFSYSNIHFPESATLTERANIIRRWIKSGEGQAVSELFIFCHNLIWLPVEVCELVNLSLLDADHNHIAFLPSDIGKLKNLQVLHLAHNLLSSVPPEFAQLTELRDVYLYYNKFVSLPHVFRRLPMSVKIHIGNNGITRQTPGMAEVYNKICLEEEDDVD